MHGGDSNIEINQLRRKRRLASVKLFLRRILVAMALLIAAAGILWGIFWLCEICVRETLPGLQKSLAVRTLTLFPWLFALALSEAKTARLPNLLTLGCLLSGIGISAFVGGVSPLSSIGAATVGAAVLLPFFLRKFIDAGTVKMFAAAMAFWGVGYVPFGFASSLCMGVAVGLTGSAWRRWFVKLEERHVPSSPIVLLSMMSVVAATWFWDGRCLIGGYVFMVVVLFVTAVMKHLTRRRIRAAKPSDLAVERTRLPLSAKCIVKDESYDFERNRDAFPHVDYETFVRPYFSVFGKPGEMGVVESHTRTVVVKPVFEEVQLMYDRRGSLIDNIINLKEQGQWSLYRLGYGYPISPSFKPHGHLREGLQHVSYRGKLHGFVDCNQKIVLPFVYADAKSFSEGLCAVMWIPKDEWDGNDGWGYIDHEGICIIPGCYLDACKFHGGFARVQGKVGDFAKWSAMMRLDTEEKSRLRAWWASSHWGIVTRAGGEIMPCTNSLDVVHSELYRLRHPSLGAYNREGYVASKDNIAIARDFVFVRDAKDTVIALNLKGELLSECDGKEVGVGARVESWRDIRQVAAGFDHVVGLTSSGRLVSLGNTREFSMATTIRSWRNLTMVDACEGHVAGVMFDGRIEIATETGGYERPNDYSQELHAVVNARRIAVGWLHAAVLLSDGSVKVVGKHNNYCNVGQSELWKDVVDLDVFGCYYSPIQTVGLTSAGQVLHTLDDDTPDSWRDIVSVSCGDAFIVALDKFGKVHACGRNDHGQCDVTSWPKMTCVKGDFFTTVAIDTQGWIWMTPVGKTRHNVFGVKGMDGAVFKESSMI